jgi:CubicO group peptidase (beta-lactamase class C family)
MAGMALPCLAQAPPAVVRLDGKALGAAEVDAVAAKLMAEHRVPGMGLALFTHGRISYLKAYGLRDVAGAKPLSTDTVFTAASLTKPAFACLVLQLAQAGRLDLDKPIAASLAQPLPDHPDYRDLAADPRWKRITPRMLLDHTSGFPNWRFLEDDKKLHIHFEPGTRFAYSGEGIMLLQRVVEDVEGRSLTELMQERLFAPLGMARTSMVWKPDFEADAAVAYDEDGRALEAQRWSRPNAAGGMQTTLGDYARFLEAAMGNGGLEPGLRTRMLSPQVRIHSAHEFPTLSPERTRANDRIRLSYGLGWGLYWTPKGKAFFKEGHDDGLRHYAVGFEASGTGLLVMTNSSNGEALYRGLLESLLANPWTPLAWERFPPFDKP